MTKRKVKLDFTPSPYQEKFFDWVAHGVGNAVITAVAGAGKTSTAIASTKFIPSNEKIMFICFNKAIARELEGKLANRNSAKARTLHSLGYTILRGHFGEIVQDEYKYRKYIKSNIAELTTVGEDLNTMQRINRYIDTISALIDFSRFNLAQTPEEINKVAEKYNIAVDYDECLVTKKCLDWGKEHTEVIDYTDMIWLPVELSLSPGYCKYDWIFFDEAQDASLCSIQMFLKCLKRGGRFVAIGDELQSINMFAGSSEEAFTFLKEYKNTTHFELPVSYRCGKKIVELANVINPSMLARDGAQEGVIVENCKISDIKEGDMVLARTKAPLVKLYAKLLKKGVNCYLKGNDIANQLISILEKIDKKELNVDLNEDGVFVRLYDNLFEERNKMMQTRGLDYDDATLSMNIMNKYDNINTLQVLAEKCKTKQQLISHINDIFSDDRSGICLSTVHKSKGLEADNVYILCRSTMPSKLAQADWEVQQEINLIYVAYTRAKNLLGFVSEKEIKPQGASQEPDKIIDELAFIEYKVCKVLGKQPMERLSNVDLSRFKLEKMTEVEDLHEDDNKVTLTVKETNSDNILLELEEYID